MPNLLKQHQQPATQPKPQRQKPSLRHRQYRKRSIAPSTNMAATITAPSIAQRTKAKWTKPAKYIALTKRLPTTIVKNIAPTTKAKKIKRVPNTAQTIQRPKPMLAALNTARTTKPQQPKTATPNIAHNIKHRQHINADPSTAKNTEGI